MLRCVFCIVASYFLFSFVVIFAQSQPEVRKRIIYKEKSYFDFEDTLIRGNKIGPAGTNVFRKDQVEFKSSLNLKRSFMPELRESAEGDR